MSRLRVLAFNFWGFRVSGFGFQGFRDFRVYCLECCKGNHTKGFAHIKGCAGSVVVKRRGCSKHVLKTDTKHPGTEMTGKGTPLSRVTAASERRLHIISSPRFSREKNVIHKKDWAVSENTKTNSLFCSSSVTKHRDLMSRFMDCKHYNVNQSL